METTNPYELCLTPYPPVLWTGAEAKASPVVVSKLLIGFWTHMLQHLVSPMPKSRLIWASLLPLVSSSRTASRLNSAVYTLPFFAIFCSSESGIMHDLAYLGVHSSGGTSFAFQSQKIQILILI